jgi:hypothetical protein
MSSVSRLDIEKLRVRRIIATATLTAVVVSGLLYRGGVAFVSSLSEATASASRGVDGPGTVAPTTEQVPVFAPPDRTRPADQMFASGTSRPEPSAPSSPAAPSNPEDSTPIAREQRVLKSRHALETIDPREFLRHGTSSK